MRDVHNVHLSLAYLRLSSTPNTLSAVSSSGKTVGFLDSLRLTGLPDKTAYRKESGAGQHWTSCLKLVLLNDHTN